MSTSASVPAVAPDGPITEPIPLQELSDLLELDGVPAETILSTIAQIENERQVGDAQ